MKFKSNFIFVFIFLIVSLILSGLFVNADEYQYGIHQLSGEFDISQNIESVKLTYLRDNFYGALFINTTGSVIFRTLEVENYKIIDPNIDELVIGTYTNPKNLDLITFNNDDGLSMFSFTDSSGAFRLYSLNIYANGSINGVLDSYSHSDSHTNSALIKLPNDGYWFFLRGGTTYGDTTNTYTFNKGGYIISDGSFDPINDYPYNYEYNPNDESKIQTYKYSGTCNWFFRRADTNTIWYNTDSCSYYASGTAGKTTDSNKGSQYEANVINNLDLVLDDNAGFVYMTYTETIDNYPVINVMNASSHATLDKIRLFNETADNTKVFLLSDNYLLMVYTLEEGSYDKLYAKTFSVDEDGVLTEEYESSLYTDVGFTDLIKMPTTYDNYFLGFEGFGELGIMSLSIGIIPPPTAEDTQISLLDERTLEAYNMTDQTLTFKAHCENNIMYQEEITTETQSIPVSCNYTSFEIKVEFEYSGTNYAYSRYYLRNLDNDIYNRFNLNSYLINPYDTDFVSNEYVIDDLSNAYENAKLYFEKNINGNTTQITAAEIDLTNSMRAVLMTGETYYLYLESEDTGRNYIGTYLSPSAGSSNEVITLHLYDISLTSSVNRLIDTLEYQINVNNNTIDYFVTTIEGVNPNLINMTIDIYSGGGTSRTLIYSDVKGSDYDANNLYTLFSDNNIDLSDYINTTVEAELTMFFEYDGDIRQKTYSPTLWTYNKIELPLTEYVSEDFLNWFFLILLSVIAIFATIKTADIMAIAILILAAVFMMFGWFTITNATLVFAILVSIVNVIKKGMEDL